MKVDLRAFRYEADPVLHQRRWQLDAAVAKLGHLQGRVAAALATLTQLRAQLQAQCAASLESRAARVDPQMHVRSLQWLVRLQGDVDRAAVQHQDAECERDVASEHLRALQCKVEAMETHREETVAQFAIDQAARDAAEADREWLAMRTVAGSSCVDHSAKGNP